jgi:NAD(P)H dehydrogenase (quinone)
MPTPVKVHIFFYSTYGHVWRLAEAIAEGARKQPGAEVQIFRIAETLPDEVLAKMGALEARKQWQHLPVGEPRTLDQADAIIIGTPTRYGSAAAQVRAFLDNTAGHWVKGGLIGKVGSGFTSTASQHGGQETTLLTLATFFFHQGMVITGVPYSSQELLNMAEMTGGSPYGAGTVAGPKGERQPSANELAIARAQGIHVAQIAAKLARKD